MPLLRAPRTRTSAVAVAAIAIALLAGCTASPAKSPKAVSSAEPSSQAAAEPSQTPVPTVAPNNIGLTDSWTDSIGYSFTLTVSSFAVTTSIDTADALPGKSLVVYSLDVSGSLTNTTSGRNARQPSYNLLSPIWSKASAFCTLGGFGDPWATNDAALKNKFCTPFTQGVGISSLSTTAELTAGETEQIAFHVDNTISVDEAKATELASALKAPELWILSRDDGADLQTSCLVQSGGYYVSQATGATGCHT